MTDRSVRLSYGYVPVRHVVVEPSQLEVRRTRNEITFSGRHVPTSSLSYHPRFSGSLDHLDSMLGRSGIEVVADVVVDRSPPNNG